MFKLTDKACRKAGFYKVLLFQLKNKGKNDSVKGYVPVDGQNGQNTISKTV